MPVYMVDKVNLVLCSYALIIREVFCKVNSALKPTSFFLRCKTLTEEVVFVLLYKPGLVCYSEVKSVQRNLSGHRAAHEDWHHRGLPAV